MKILTLFLLSFFLFGCYQPSDTPSKDEKLKGCLVDQAVSSVVDPKNLMLYAATADLMSRALVLEQATIVSNCRSIIIASRNNIDLLNTLANDYCPKKLMELSDEQLIKLDKKAMEIIRLYSNLTGSIADQVLGRCAEL